MRARQACTASLLALALASCASDPTQVVVVLHADRCVASRAARVRVRVTGPEGSVADHDHMLSPDGGASGVRWPLRIPLVPRGGDASRVFGVEASLYAMGATEPLAVQRLQGRFVDGRKREVHRCFTPSCYRSGAHHALDCDECPAGGPGDAGSGCTTCATGRCVSAWVDVAREEIPLGADPCGSPPASETGLACFDACDEDSDGRADCDDADCEGVAESGDGCCGGARVDVSSDDAHCGACSTACDASTDCCGGTCCAPAACCNGTSCCAGTSVICCEGAGCVDPTTSHDNCGGCGNVCGAGADACCGGACVNTRTDGNNCGGCGVSCAALGAGGRCCSGTCVDVFTSNAHCGGCGNAVAAGEVCCGGEQCNADAQRWGCCGDASHAGGSRCTDLSNDKENCGRCGRACPFRNDRPERVGCVSDDATHCYDDTLSGYCQCDRTGGEPGVGSRCPDGLTCRNDCDATGDHCRP